MKFICDKCKTKYSIADTKVRGKVLKIRCKNCSNIITVREQKRGTDARRRKDSSPVGNSTGALGRALDGAFKETQPITHGMQVVAVPDIAPAPAAPPGPLTSEPTRISDAPDFDEPPSEEEEWYLAVDGNQFGPMDLSELCNRVKRGEALPEEAFVWHDGFDDWLDVSEVPQLQPHIPKHPPPPPKGKSGLLALGALVDDSGRTPSSSGLPAVDSLAEEATSPPPPAEQPAEIKPVPTPIAPVVRAPQPSGPQGQIAADPDLLDTVPKDGEDDDIAPIVPVASITPATPPPQSTALMKVAAAGGIVAAISGLILVVYILAFDRQPTKPDLTQTKIVQATPKPEDKPAAKPEPAKAPEVAANVEIEFQPETITRTQPRSKPSRRATKGRPTVAKKPSGPQLTEAQKRMMAMYKKGGTSIPGVSSARKSSVKHRQLTGSEVARMYGKYKKQLQACYQRVLKRDETLKELKVDVSIEVSNMGRVRNVTFRNLPSVSLAGCLKRIIRRWAFQPSGEQTIAFPLVFRGAG